MMKEGNRERNIAGNVSMSAKINNADIRRSVKKFINETLETNREKKNTSKDMKKYSANECVKEFKKYSILELLNMGFYERQKLRIYGKSIGSIGRMSGFSGQPDLVHDDMMKFLLYVWKDAFEDKLKQEYKAAGMDYEHMKSLQEKYIAVIKEYRISTLLAMSRTEKESLSIYGKSLREIAHALFVFVSPEVRPTYMEKFLKRVWGDEYEIQLAQEKNIPTI